MRRFAHQIWQLLPQTMRRAMLFRATYAFAPRPSQPAPLRYPEPIIVVGFLTAATGLGEWARLAIVAFTAAGYEVRGIDLSSAMMQGGGVEAGHWRDGRDCMGAGTIMLHVNAPYVPLAMQLLGRKLVRGKRIVGCWAWELPSVPPEWRHGLPFVHEVWGLSNFTATAIRATTSLPVKATPLPLRPVNLPPPAEWAWQKPEGSFAVLMIFNMASGFTRKNPLGAIAAFQAAFGHDPDCHLLIKIVNAESYPAGLAQLEAAALTAGNIELMTRTLPPAHNAALIAACDVVISLHRAEGFGLVPAEAMQQGKPVVATGWSGNLDFMAADTACLVNYTLVPAQDPQATYEDAMQNWAEPDTAHAAGYLRQLRNDPAFAKALGKRGQEAIGRHLSLAAYANHLRIDDNINY